MSGDTIEMDQTVECEDKISKTKFVRKYDIVVLGASGFTGQFVVKEMVNYCQTYNLTWAVAGRDAIKLQKVLDNVYIALSKLLF